MDNVLHITQKIRGVGLANEVSADAGKIETPAPVIQHMHEKLERPAVLNGRTYKIKPVAAGISHAFYITINDVVLNEGTDHEVRRPYEVFINTKEASSFQWITALTRVMSAVFRKGGDGTFLVEELMAVFDPQGGYFVQGQYVPSVIAHIGQVIRDHMVSIGMLKLEISEEAKQLIAEKSERVTDAQLKNARVCNACHAKTVVTLDGCDTCLSCGNSKCG